MQRTVFLNRAINMIERQDARTRTSGRSTTQITP